MKTGYLHLLLILILCSTTLAQNATLKGTVTDKETSKALPGANIMLASKNLETGTATGLDGAFELPQLPPDEYSVTITFIGYKKTVVENVILRSGDTRRLKIRLEPTDIQVNPVTVTASRRPEKLLEAPAAISVLETESIEQRMALTATEHLKAMPAVDIISVGLNQSRVVVRGFNDLFSGSLLSMVDNRITRVPAVRLNAFQMIPTNNDDVDRIEIVSGPASALYGPNSANGVMHVLTKSPFDSKGTTVSVGGGERDVFLGSVRHANTLGNLLGYKFSIQHYQGRDFEYRDPVEEQFRELAIDNGANPDSLRIGRRIFDIESTAFDGRVDLHLMPDFKFILNGGYSNGDNIEPTNQGAAQALDAQFSYLQARLIYKNLFAQAYMNSVTTGDTYFLRSGQSIINNSSLFVTQVQHSLILGERQRFTYGSDLLLTRPDTEGTINGINEDQDDVNEIGVYLQSETALSQKLKFVGAARLDEHNRLEGWNFSPRAALVYKPTLKDNFRLTFNRAFVTPTSDMLFSDNSVSAPSEPTLTPLVGDTFLNFRALGSYPTGFTFRRDASGNPMMIRTFDQVYSDNYVPTTVNQVWPQLRQLLIANAPTDSFRMFLEFLPMELNQPVPGVLGIIDTESTEGDFRPIEDVQDVGRISESTNTTFEIGYKGLLSKKLLAGVDIYHTRIENFIGPISVISPSVYIDSDSLTSVLKEDVERNVQGTNFESYTRFLPFIVQGLDNLPIGILSPEEIENSQDVILAYRNLGDVSVAGMDLSLTYYLNKTWTLTGNYSFVNRDLFKVEGGDRIALNAPRHKIGAIVDYRNPTLGLTGNLRLRFVDSFPVQSGTFQGKVERYAVIDVNASYQLPFLDGSRISLSIQNIMDNKHREFVGVPEVGRLAWMRLVQTL